MNNYLPKILITGGNGQLANALRYHAQASHFALDIYSRQELDILDDTSINHSLGKLRPDVVINTAAYTAVDKAELEQEKEIAMHVNHQGAKNIAMACHTHQITLIHVSTDYVFDGTKTEPYQEDDLINPINFYGQSKWSGEEAIRKHCEKHIIVRTSGVFSEYGNNFLKTIVRIAQEKKELRVVSDQITCPTYAGDIANALFMIAKNNNHFGTYHFCSKEPTSWYQFAVAINALAKQTLPLTLAEVKAIPTIAYPTPAKRPAYSVLDCSKINQHFGIMRPSLELGIKKSLSKMLEKDL